jgi:hypothetical protein
VAAAWHLEASILWAQVDFNGLGAWVLGIRPLLDLLHMIQWTGRKLR